MSTNIFVMMVAMKRSSAGELRDVDRCVAGRGGCCGRLPGAVLWAAGPKHLMPRFRGS
jgi:hypothetical protein